MTPEQRSFFRDNGYLFLRGAHTEKNVAPIKAFILSELKRLKIWSSGKMLSSSLRDIPAFQQITKLSQLIKHEDLQAHIVTEPLRLAIHLLAEVELTPAQSAQLLISLPNQGDWRINGLSWHVDISSPSPARMPGIQVFTLIDDVKPRGGATLALARSHLLETEERSRRVREILRSSADIEGDLSEHKLSIVEMSGRAGDVCLMDMRLLHTPSMNSTKHIRMMATARYFAL
jgi:ectoine hydroxylase-related dioxygenase (phytanoyl-CoA dioxygenase family)